MLNVGATVIIAGRSEKTLSSCIETFKKEIKDAKVDGITIDLGDLPTIQNFVSDFNSKYDKLDSK